MTIPDADAVTAIADLARRDSERIPARYPVDPHDSLVVVKVRGDERLQEVDLEPYLPQPVRPHGNALVHDPTDFIDLTNRLADLEHTTVWANVDAGTVTALINDHADSTSSGWRDHTVQLRLQPDEDWQRWIARDGKLTTQADFADFIEDVFHTVRDPDAATMLEVATTMSASRSVEFSQGTRLQTGDVQLTFNETTTSNAGKKGQVQVPERITVSLAPWRSVTEANLDAKLRWRIVGGQLAIGYKIIRPELFQAEVFESLIEHIREGLTEGVPLYRGAEPASLRR